MQFDPVLFGKYWLLRRVSVGGMAEVYQGALAGQFEVPRMVALKRMLPALAEDESFVRMFLDEAKITMRFQHPNIVPMYETGKCMGQYYIAMEYLPSRELRTYLDRVQRKKQKFSISQAAFIGYHICLGLDYAHRLKDEHGQALNIVHRDVSPQNVLIGYNGEIKVIDFGIAKAEQRQSKTQAGVIKGKFAYMPPEQLLGKPISHQADIYAVGVILYEMFTGVRPFVGKNDLETIDLVRQSKVVAPRKINPLISADLERLILKALHKDVKKRHQWASELATDLAPYMMRDGRPFDQLRLSQHMREAFPVELSEEQRRTNQFVDYLQKQANTNVQEDSVEYLRRKEDIAAAIASKGDSERTYVFESAEEFQRITGVAIEGLKTRPKRRMSDSEPTVPGEGAVDTVLDDPQTVPTVEQNHQLAIPQLPPSAQRPAGHMVPSGYMQNPLYHRDDPRYAVKLDQTEMAQLQKQGVQIEYWMPQRASRVAVLLLAIAALCATLIQMS